MIIHFYHEPKYKKEKYSRFGSRTGSIILLFREKELKKPLQILHKNMEHMLENGLLSNP